MHRLERTQQFASLLSRAARVSFDFFTRWEDQAELEYKKRNDLRKTLVGMMKIRLASIVLLVSVAAGGIFLWRRGGNDELVQAASIDDLRIIVEQEERAAEEGVKNYVPAFTGRISDLATPIVSILRTLPGVVRVDVSVSPGTKPTHRIVHLLDWHFVPRDLFAIDQKAVSATPLDEDAIDSLFREHLFDVERIQLEHTAIVRCLARHHHMRSLYSEGLTTEGVQGFLERIAVLRAMSHGDIPKLRSHLQDVRQLKSDGTGKAVAIEQQILGMLEDHRRRVLEVGIPGRLLMDGHIASVLPLDDASSLRNAKPITPKGELKPDSVKVEARERAIVTQLLKGDGVAVIVLGGSHDLSSSVRQLSGGTCEYIRVTTRRFAALVEGECSGAIRDR